MTGTPRERDLALAGLYTELGDRYARLAELLRQPLTVVVAGSYTGRAAELNPELAKLLERGHDEPTSVCGCSLYGRCASHERARPRGCVCNGPVFCSAECPDATHARLGREHPEYDPLQVG